MKNIKKSAIALALLSGISFVANAAATEFIIKQSVMGMIEPVKVKPSYLSCQSLKKTVPSSPSGTYLIKPIGWDGEAFELYCDMEKDGGGWTLIYKQSNFAANAPVNNATNPSALKDIAFGAGKVSYGNIARYFPNTESMIYSNESNYFVLRTGFNKLKERGCDGNAGHKCLTVGSFLKSKVGLPTIGVNSTVTLAYAHNAVSGFMIGNSPSTPWCSLVHGRYNGMCMDGSYGLGNWAIFVR